jgi:hypothetical protein
MFVRRKILKGNPYGYLVENTWTDKGPRQKVVEYLGRIHDVDEKEAMDLSSVEDADILSAVVEHEVSEDIQVDLKKRTVQKNGESIVLGLNGGVLCDQTLAQVFKGLHTRNESRPGIAFATALRNAGLRIDKQSFIQLYVSVRK